MSGKGAGTWTQRVAHARLRHSLGDSSHPCHPPCGETFCASKDVFRETPVSSASSRPCTSRLTSIPWRRDPSRPDVRPEKRNKSVSSDVSTVHVMACASAKAVPRSCRNVLACSGLCRHVPACAGMCRNRVGLCRHVKRCAKLCRTLFPIWAHTNPPVFCAPIGRNLRVPLAACPPLSDSHGRQAARGAREFSPC